MAFTAFSEFWFFPFLLIFGAPFAISLFISLRLVATNKGLVVYTSMYSRQPRCQAYLLRPLLDVDFAKDLLGRV